MCLNLYKLAGGCIPRCLINVMTCLHNFCRHNPLSPQTFGFLHEIAIKYTDRLQKSLNERTHWRSSMLYLQATRFSQDVVHSHDTVPVSSSCLCKFEGRWTWEMQPMPQPEDAMFWMTQGE